MNKWVGFLCCTLILSGCCGLENNFDSSLSLPEEVTCGICEFLVAKIETHLENNQTQLEIIQFLAKECTHLPHEQWVGACQLVVVAYGEQLIVFTLNKQTPKKSCEELGVCTSLTFLGKKEPLAANPVECKACDLIVKQAQHYLAQNLTEEVILGLISKDCSTLIIKNLVDTCTELVGKYGKQIIQLLTTNVSPSGVCSNLQLCPTSASTLPCETVDRGRHCDLKAMESKTGTLL